MNISNNQSSHFAKIVIKAIITLSERIKIHKNCIAGKFYSTLCLEAVFIEQYAIEKYLLYWRITHRFCC